MSKNIEGIFPHLLRGQYRVTSGKTKKYNCIAWAAGNNNKWWEPLPMCYWPKGVPREYTVAALVKLYEQQKYCDCSLDISLEEGFEKVAIFSAAGEYSHAAKQLETGKWSSKIGELEDIEHDFLEGIAGGKYGKVVKVMKRAKVPTQDAKKKKSSPTK